MRSERLVQAKRRCHLVSRMARRIVCLMGVAALACAGAEGPVDELEAVWIAQDGPIPTNMTHAAWRAEKLETCVYVGEEGEGHLRVGGTGYFSTPHLSMGRAASCRNCSVTLEGDGRLVLGDITVKGAVGATANFNGGTLATYEGMRRCVPFIAPTIATRIQSGGARIEVGLDAWAELPGVLAGKVAWAPGSALLIDTRNGPVRISGHDLLGASVVEKTGANDLVLTSSPVGVSEIRVRQGNLRTSEPDIIPPAVKVLSLGGQFLNNGG